MKRNKPYISISGTSRHLEGNRVGAWGAVFLLLIIFSCTAPHHSERRAQLDSLQVVNQADTVFRSDSLQRILVDYFDAHGTANDRMLAHYLLGRAYYDMGETPLALHHYHEAIESADTTDKDCDFRQLGRIHGQAAWLLLKQNTPQNAIEEMGIAKRYALKCYDTQTVLSYYNIVISAYEKMNMEDSAIMMAYQARNVMESMGFRDKGIGMTMIVADAIIRKGRIKEARELIDEYEKLPGTIDAEGNVRSGMEFHYYIKGLLYLSEGKPVHARKSFHKLLTNAKRTNDYECAYEGLSRTYLSMGEKDSALHYSMLAYAYNDSCHREKNSDVFSRTQAMFNYGRLQQLAANKTHELLIQKNRTYLLSSLALLLFMLLLFIQEHVRRYKKKTLHRIADFDERYASLSLAKMELEDMLEESKNNNKALSSQQNSMRATMDELHTEYERIIALEKNIEETNAKLLLQIEEKKKYIEDLESELKSVKVPEQIQKQVDMEKALLETQIVQKFVQFGKDMKSRPTSSDWAELHSTVNKYLPGFFNTIRAHDDILLNISEIEICTLVRLRISLSGISYITKYSLSSLSNMRSMLLTKVFGIDKGSCKEFDKLIMKVF